MNCAFEIFLFDLDDTLIRTTDLKGLREACKNNTDPVHLKKVRDALQARPDRHIFGLPLLRHLRANFPTLKLGVFTRSPRSYASTVLEWAYPGFAWDIVIAYEDVRRTKPHGEGIDKAMRQFNVRNTDNVVLVGDTLPDMYSAYNCGCQVILSTSAWPPNKIDYEYDHWDALLCVPDAIIDEPAGILEFLIRPKRHLPELERLLDREGSRLNGPRFDKLNHFVARAAEMDKRPYPIYVCGRSFSNHDSVQWRRDGHSLTSSIEDNKESENFPEEWINTIRSFIADSYNAFTPESQNIIVSVVPHRPGRRARLELLLAQLQHSIEQNPIPGLRVRCIAGVLAYRDGVRSQHNDLLNRDERFINVRDHLSVKDGYRVESTAPYVIIDDVVTTGASLIYAYKYLRAAGVRDIKCLALAKNVGNVLC